MGDNLVPVANKEILEKLYAEYNKRELVSSDPVQFLWDYDDSLDREIVGLISSSLAYGRVAQILRSISSLLEKMAEPSEFLRVATPISLKSTFEGFRHRFTTGEDVAMMLYGAKVAIEKYGSLNECFLTGLSDNDETILLALDAFVRELSLDEGMAANHLLPFPERKSACKRLNLFLRWMVRENEVDPGGWTGVPVSKLIIPLDTHMYDICRTLGITKRKQADMRTAMEITDYFRNMNPEDPVRYDFALTRLGILDDTDLPSFLEKWRAEEVH